VHKLSLADVNKAMGLGELHDVEVRLKHAGRPGFNLYKQIFGLKMPTY
jgi:hypothetical protein